MNDTPIKPSSDKPPSDLSSVRADSSISIVERVQPPMDNVAGVSSEVVPGRAITAPPSTEGKMVYTDKGREPLYR